MERPPILISTPRLAARYSNLNIASTRVMPKLLSWKYLPNNALPCPPRISSFEILKLKVDSVRVLATPIKLLPSNNKARPTPARNRFSAIFFFVLLKNKTIFIFVQ